VTFGRNELALEWVATALLDEKFVFARFRNQGMDLIGRDADLASEICGASAGIGFDHGEELLAALAAGRASSFATASFWSAFRRFAFARRTRFAFDGCGWGAFGDFGFARGTRFGFGWSRRRFFGPAAASAWRGPLPQAAKARSRSFASAFSSARRDWFTARTRSMCRSALLSSLTGAQ
jgi:hypothetical protein